jgi:hypothetical protein
MSKVQRSVLRDDSTSHRPPNLDQFEEMSTTLIYESKKDSRLDVPHATKAQSARALHYWRAWASRILLLSCVARDVDLVGGAIFAPCT